VETWVTSSWLNPLREMSLLKSRGGSVREIIGGGEPFREPSRGIKVSRLEFPSTEKPVFWEARLAPMIVERGVGIDSWIIIASPIWCDEFKQYGAPTPPYIQFEYVNGNWIWRPVDRRWYGRVANLLMREERRKRADKTRVGASQIAAENIPLAPTPAFTRYFQIDPKVKSDCAQK
ncbi:MAG: hypothetical protein LCH79_15880, partial [Proteobacteria bacterium]|nr:hypothetical protein [Pseudomonadota bacterium]